MSGIAGLYRLDSRPVDPCEPARMIDAMPHRGPDGARAWTEGAVGLGHRMLFTTPESLHEVLPLSDSRAGLTITADARIDNRDDLLDRLGLEDEAPDSTLILRSYERWGPACVDHLLGDFAFAIWDEPNRRLFCAKDHLGIKDLYFVHQPGRLFTFASEIKALFALNEVDDEIDDDVLAGYITRALLDSGRTVFRHVHRLLPGHTLTVSPEGIETRHYWAPAPSAERVPSTDEACTERFLELFTEAVRCRLRSAFPVGAELSGGLDSSFVACVARDLLGADEHNPMPTVSLVYDLFPDCDERPFIEPVVAQGGIRPHYVAVEEHGLLNLLDDIYTYLDDGRAGGNHHLNWLTAVGARQAGMRVVLTGHDGDTTVGHGWELLTELARAERWDDFADEVRAAAARIREERSAYHMQEAAASESGLVSAYALPVLEEWAAQGAYLKLGRAVEALVRHFGASRKKVYTRLWRDMLLPARVVEGRRRRAKAASGRRSLPRIMNPELAQRLNIAERLAQKRLSEPKHETGRAQQQFILDSPYLTFSVEKISQYAAANGVEARHPFMDRRLVEYCLALSLEQSFKEGWSRIIMRRAMEGIAPPAVQWRMGKTHLGPPYRHIFVTKSPERLRELAADLGPAEAYLDAAYVNELYQNRETLSEDDLRSLGLAITISYWLRRRSQEREVGMDRAAGVCSS